MRQRIKIALLIILPCILACLYMWANYEPDFILSYANTDYGTYTDSTSGEHGNSKVSSFRIVSGAIELEYVLQNKIAYPYLGIYLGSKPKQNFFDFSRYDHMEVDLKAEHSRRIPIIINTHIANYSHDGDPTSFRHLTRIIDYEQGKTLYKIALKDFQTPSWWFSKKKLTQKEIGFPNFGKVRSVDIQNCEVLGIDQKEKVIFRKIRFYKDLSMSWLVCISGMVVYYLFLGFVYFFSRKKIEFFIFPHKKLDINNTSDNEQKLVLEYLAHNYSNPEMSLENLQKELGLSENKISMAIKSKSGMNFKKYLNHIRISEAKRLLVESDRQVMEIAYLVGYGNISHFNRVFKDSEDCSPNEFRKNNPKK